jgi:hypothetical protein
MSLLASLLTGLALGLVFAAAAAFYLWRVWRPRREVFEGRRILSGMRWRELSNLVLDALASVGFEPESREKQSERGVAAERVMRRDGRPWLLACKQGLDHRVGAPAAEDLLREVRSAQAAGAVLVTPGSVEPAARTVAPNIELLDGEELWRLLEPRLPESVHLEVATRARTHAYRQTAGVAVAAVVVAALATSTLRRFEPAIRDVAAETPPDAPAQPAPAVSVPARPTPPVAVEPLVVDEEAQRSELARRLSGLPGIDRAIWSTRSTLQVFVTDPAIANDTAICQTVERYELLRASRLQLDPPPGEDRPVRFIQCRVY